MTDKQADTLIAIMKCIKESLELMANNFTSIKKVNQSIETDLTGPKIGSAGDFNNESTK